jgi:transposase
VESKSANRVAIELPLSDSDWAIVSHLFSTSAVRGRPRIAPRDVLSAILWIEQNGECWKHLPVTFPSQQTCYNKFISWRSDGTLQKVQQALTSSAIDYTEASFRSRAPQSPLLKK